MILGLPQGRYHTLKSCIRIADALGLRLEGRAPVRSPEDHRKRVQRWHRRDFPPDDGVWWFRGWVRSMALARGATVDFS
jgi:hypothetical protein